MLPCTIILLLLTFLQNVYGDCEKFPEFRTSKSCDPHDYCRTQVRHNSEFDAKRRKCILPIGSPCAVNETSTLVSCPLTSFCSKNNKCECEELFVPDIMRMSCNRGMSFDAACSYEFDQPPKLCPITEGFRCDLKSQRCVCVDGRFYNAETDSCVKTRCEERGDEESKSIFFDWRTQECTLEIGEDKGFYFLRYLRDNLIKCPINAHIKEGHSKIRVGPPVGICECDSGYHPARDRRSCVLNKSHGEVCDAADDDCDSWAGLSCLRGSCECQYAVWSQKDTLCYSAENCRRRDPDSYFDAGQIACYKMVGRGCDIYEGVKCPQGSDCRNTTMLGYTCECDEDFNPLTKGEGCAKAKLYGEICGVPGKNSDKGFNPCSKQSKLSCMKTGPGLEGAKSFPKCGCGTNEVWNPKSKVCNLRAGQKCTVYGRMMNDFECGERARCVGKKEGDEVGICTCDKGYVKASTGQCIGMNEEPTYTKCMITSAC